MPFDTYVPRSRTVGHINLHTQMLTSSFPPQYFHRHPDVLSYFPSHRPYHSTKYPSQPSRNDISMVSSPHMRHRALHDTLFCTRARHTPCSLHKLSHNSIHAHSPYRHTSS